LQQRSEHALRKNKAVLETLLHREQLIQEDLEYVTSRLFHLQDDERKRISRELHDEVGQLLTSIGLNLQIALEKLDGGTPQVQRRLSDTAALVSQVHDRIRQYLRDLRPMTLEAIGLLPALWKLGGELSGSSEMRIIIEGDEVDDYLPSEHKMALYRIVQEGLTNAIKHSGARCISVDLRGDGRFVRLLMHDDGGGFRREDIAVFNSGGNLLRNSGKGEGLGLAGIRERVVLLGGEVSIRQHDKKGATLEVTLPLTTRRPS